MVKLLLKNGYKYTANAIDKAAENGHLNMVKFLLKQYKEFIYNPTDIAIKRCNYKILGLLIRAKRESEWRKPNK